MTSKGRFECDDVLLAPGRSGHGWLKKECDELGLEVRFNPLDVGVRVEVSNKIMKDMVENYGCHDPKFHIRTPTNDDFVRTFCVCYGGFVTVESYGKSPYGVKLYGVNGHSYSRYGRKSKNTNFALLVRQHLTEPQVDTTRYGYSFALMGNTIAGEKTLIQRVADLQDHRRSTWERIGRSSVKPTLSKEYATPGDIRMALSYKVTRDIMEGLEMLDKVIPGVYTGNTLVYAPEIKFYARRVMTNGLLQTSIPNLYVAGDGAGVSRGIVAAAATGIVAARGIKASAR